MDIVIESDIENVKLAINVLSLKVKTLKYKYFKTGKWERQELSKLYFTLAAKYHDKVKQLAALRNNESATSSLFPKSLFKSLFKSLTTSRNESYYVPLLEKKETEIFSPAEATLNLYLYAFQTGACYHRWWCYSMRSIPITDKEIKSRELKPCKTCKPRQIH